ncbi:hypothetical protein HY212_02235 [Candidatus Pacearchaeota archaeon]|nr:hypothetical protein [Candidatus Pacearchaeota archaeon]
MRGQKKGQAAMEFLMTYGWAILAAIIVVGVLWYLIGNPSNLAGKQYTLSAPLSINAISITAGAPGTVQLEIRNGAGSSINVTTIDFSEPTCTDITPNLLQPQGNLTAYSISCNPLTAGNRFLSDITVKYTTTGSSLTQQSTGSISAKI